MKKTFLKAVAAAAVVAATVALSSVAAFAGALPELQDPTKPLEMGTTYDMNKNGGVVASNSGGTIVENGQFSYNCTVDGSGLKVKQQSSTDQIAKFLTPAEQCRIAITISNDKAATLSYGDSNTLTCAANSRTKSDIIPASTIVTLNGATTSGATITTIEVLPPVDQTKDVTIKVTDFTSGNDLKDVITVTGDGEEVQASQDGTYTLSIGTEYTVSADGYSSESFTVTDETTSVELILISDEALNNGKELNLSNCKITIKDTSGNTVAPILGGADDMFLINAGITYSDPYLRVSKDVGRNIQFTVKSKAKVIFSGIKSSNSTERTLQLMKDGTPVGSWKTKNVEIDGIVDVEPGTYTITTPDSSMQFKSVKVCGELEKPELKAICTKAASNTNVAAVQYDGKCYAVAVISKADAETATKAVLNYTADASIDTDTVYTSVKFDKEYTATDFSESASAEDYVYAVAIDDAVYSGNLVGTIQKIKVSVE